MKTTLVGFALLLSTAVVVQAVTVFEAAGSDPTSITATRDAFRTAIGGGTVAGPGGDFGGVRREINWDGVPEAQADPNALPGNFFNARGVELSTPGSSLAVSAGAGQATPPLFGFTSDFQTFSAQRLFTAIGSNIVDVTFLVPGTTTAATTSAFGLVFVDVEVPGLTFAEFFDVDDHLIFSRAALTAGNQGLSFLGAVFAASEISRVRITSGLNTIVANGVLGNPNDDVAVMDDFIYATPTVRAVPDSGPVAGLFSLVVAGLIALKRRRRIGPA